MKTLFRLVCILVTYCSFRSAHAVMNCHLALISSPYYGQAEESNRVMKHLREETEKFLGSMYPKFIKTSEVQEALNNFILLLGNDLEPILSANKDFQIKVLRNGSKFSISFPDLHTSVPFEFFNLVEGEPNRNNPYGELFIPSKETLYETAAELTEALTRTKHPLRGHLDYLKQVNSAFGIMTQTEAAQRGDVREFYPISGTLLGIGLREPHVVSRLYRGQFYSSLDEAMEIALSGHRRELPMIPEFLDMNIKEKMAFISRQSANRRINNSTVFVGYSTDKGVAEVFAGSSSTGSAVFIADIPEEVRIGLSPKRGYAYQDEREIVVPFFVSPKWIKGLYWNNKLVYLRGVNLNNPKTFAEIKPNEPMAAINTLSGKLYIGKRMPEKDSPPAYGFQHTHGTYDTLFDESHMKYFSRDEH